MRYLTEADAISAVRSGRSVEQFLPPREERTYRALRWICVRKDPDGTFSASRYEVFDEGNLDYLDLYAFSFVDPDNPSEEAVGLPSANEALKVAENRFGANPRKYVNAGVIQGEYGDFLRARNS